jgi:superfamily II helicase
MTEDNQRDDDIEELFAHIKQLRADQEKLHYSEKESYESNITIKDNTEKIVGETSLEDISQDDIFEIVKPEEFAAEYLSKMKIDIKTSAVCDICGKEFIFEDNLSGLTIRGEFYSCEKCCQDASKKTLDAWVEYKQGKPGEIKPIALWIMQENNKTQLFE